MKKEMFENGELHIEKREKQEVSGPQPTGNMTCMVMKLLSLIPVALIPPPMSS